MSKSSGSQEKQNSLSKVVKALERVSLDTSNMIAGMAKGMTEAEIINHFNQSAKDFFNTTISVTKRMGIAREYGGEAYLAIFENAIKMNGRMPIDKFTMLILEFAPEIYAEDENCFLDMEIPDRNLNEMGAPVTSDNEFSLIRSEKFKKLWKILSPADKETIKADIILLTTYAHTYFIYSLLKRK